MRYKSRLNALSDYFDKCIKNPSYIYIYEKNIMRSLYFKYLQIYKLKAQTRASFIS